MGNVGRIAQLKLGQITASINAVGSMGGASGVASFDASEAGPRDVLWIAVAGPLASLAGGVLTAVLLLGISDWRLRRSGHSSSRQGINELLASADSLCIRQADCPCFRKRC